MNGALLPRVFGNTELTVSALGFGAGHLGDPALGEEDVHRLLNAVVDAGVTLIDTAPSYGLSEARIGRALRSRREDVVLSTKVGYGVPGVPDWTAACITQGIEKALKTLGTDWLDVVHLHSCPLDTLQRGEVIEALGRARDDGKIRAAAYSGDNEALEWAIRCGRFDSVQLSLNLFDQHALNRSVISAWSRALGVVVKRPLANAPWRFKDRPAGHYCETYWHRMTSMNLHHFDIGWDELALRFAVFQPGVHSAIVGTTSMEHLKANVRALEEGPLPAELEQALRRSFDTHKRDWVSQT